jgi:ATP-dependent exoDNAse (exonuclease V) beta subunit
MSADELGQADDVVAEAVARYRHIASREDVRDLYGLGQPHHEVPFTMQIDDRIVRGTIDCLITTGDRVTVLEFKTGKARPEHRNQAEVYRTAAQTLFPGMKVESRLVYTTGQTHVPDAPTSVS